MDALRDVNLQFKSGEFVAIVGLSGSGKSTLLSVDKPTKGTIHYDETDVTRLKRKALADFRFYHFGFIFQQFHLLPTLTALENVVAPLFSRSVTFDKWKRQGALSHLLGRFSRHLLSIFALALPTALLVFFLFVTLRLRDMMYICSDRSGNSPLYSGGDRPVDRCVNYSGNPLAKRC